MGKQWTGWNHHKWTMLHPCLFPITTTLKPGKMQWRPKCQQPLFEPQVFFSFCSFHFFCQLTVFQDLNYRYRHKMSHAHAWHGHLGWQQCYNNTGWHCTHPQPYEQLLAGWIVGTAGLCNASNSHPSKPHSPNIAPESEMMSNSSSLCSRGF